MPESPPPLNLALIRRILEYTHEASGIRNVLAAMAVARAIQLPFLAWAAGAIINGPIAQKNTTWLIWSVAGYAGFALFTEVIFHFRIKLALRFGEIVMAVLRRDLFSHLMRMPMSFYHEHRVGSLISRLTSDIESVRAGVQDALFVSIVQGGQMVVAAILMLIYDPVLFLSVAAVGPILWMVNRRFQDRQSRMMRAAQESFSRITASMAEAVGGIRVTQGFSRQEQNAGIFRELVADHSRYNVIATRNAAVYTPLLEFNAQFFTAVLLIVGGWRAMNPAIGMPIGDLVMFMLLAGIFFRPFQILGTQFGTALTAMAGAERIFKLLDTPPAWEDPPGAISPQEIAGRVEFRQVGFSYTPGEPVLRNISFLAEPGQTIALVGHTGSGKTSIINLLAKFHLAQEGEILLDGLALTKISSEALHRHMGIVTQHNFLFTGTILDNIRLARPDASAEDVLAAADQLGCRQEIEDIGLETLVGEEGGGISLGQRQLVCIARAMLADPRILILDEATSAVDSLTEMKIQTALQVLLTGRTSFVIAHRLSTVRDANCVVVMEHGQIVEQGTHDALLETNGVYATLYRQFLDSAA